MYWSFIMFFIKQSMFFLVFSQVLCASHWHEHLESLSRLSISEEVKNTVYEDLLEWGPERTSSYMQIPLWFWDAYLEDEAFRGVVRAHFFSSFTQNCYELVSGQSLDCPLDAMAHASEIGIEALRVAKKLPYFDYSDFTFFTIKHSARTCTAMLSHWSAVAGYTCMSSPGAYAGDPAGWLASKITGQVFKIASVAFAGVTAYLAMDGEFIDVALRSLKRKYEIQNRFEEVAAVSMMIAHRKQRKTN